MDNRPPAVQRLGTICVGAEKRRTLMPLLARATATPVGTAHHNAYWCCVVATSGTKCGRILGPQLGRLGYIAMEECKHGTNPDWCAVCNGTDTSTSVRSQGYGFHGGETKQDILDEVCDKLGIPRPSVGAGSSLPSSVFESAAKRCAVPTGSMAEIGGAIARKTGLAWGSECDSRGSLSGGGSTVTSDGLRVILKALRSLR